MIYYYVNLPQLLCKQTMQFININTGLEVYLLQSLHNYYEINLIFY